MLRVALLVVRVLSRGVYSTVLPHNKTTPSRNLSISKSVGWFLGLVNTANQHKTDPQSLPACGRPKHRSKQLTQRERSVKARVISTAIFDQDTPVTSVWRWGLVAQLLWYTKKPDNTVDCLSNVSLGIYRQQKGSAHAVTTQIVKHVQNVILTPRILFVTLLYAQ
jgi:hypothetical protein